MATGKAKTTTKQTNEPDQEQPPPRTGSLLTETNKTSFVRRKREQKTKTAETTRDSKGKYIHLVDRVVTFQRSTRTWYMSDDICRRFNGKQQRRTRGSRSMQLPDGVMNNHKATLLLLPGSPK